MASSPGGSPAERLRAAAADGAQRRAEEPLTAEWQALKARAETAFHDGAYDTAAQGYAAAFDALRRQQAAAGGAPLELAKLRGNQSMALQRTQAWEPAVAAALEATELAPEWEKGAPCWGGGAGQRRAGGQLVRPIGRAMCCSPSHRPAPTSTRFTPPAPSPLLPPGQPGTAWARR